MAETFDRTVTVYERIVYRLTPLQVRRAIGQALRDSTHAVCLAPQSIVTFHEDGSATISTDYEEKEKPKP